jgi:Ferredoxin-like domain in Api92-like protein
MPNYVTNILTLKGPLNKVKEVFNAIAPGPTAEELNSIPKPKGGPVFKPASAANLAHRKVNNYEVDFNKIVPMPSNIFRGNLGDAEKKIHGENNWYDWSVNNWGTKWNAVESQKIDDYTVQFDTAWAMPEPVIKALSKMFPKIGVNILWADEDLGSNCGEIHYRNGSEVFSNIPEDQSKEAYELAFGVLGGEENYKYDEVKGSYVYQENESINIYKATTDLKNIFEKTNK